MLLEFGLNFDPESGRVLEQMHLFFVCFDFTSKLLDVAGLLM